ncbi:MAG: FkbM family methyltransferase [Candidatus Promineofilum sp.]|nr:FkbM family methyltransferase [Promineifilum sp.]
MRAEVERQTGVLRSLAIYYAPGRGRRLRRFYAQLIQPGDLCFDVGAHVGNRVAAWRRLGARVIAVEPQAHLMGWLRRFYSRSPAVTLVQAAVGAMPGTATLRHDPRNPTVSTLSDDWIAAVSHDPSFSHVRWRAAEVVRLTTLDELITRYGRPALCKIDVEGYEAEVLRGLSEALPLISFEYIPAAVEVARACLARLGVLGVYEFNWFPGESHRWAASSWLSSSEMALQLDKLATGRASGDIFARLVSVA